MILLINFRCVDAFSFWFLVTLLTLCKFYRRAWFASVLKAAVKFLISDFSFYSRVE